MRGEETIVDFIYTHGRFEKGGLSSRFIGVQAKSKKITRQSSDSRSDSAINVKQQCESAYDHKFNWNGNEIRLDVVELWMSKHITEDAESEFNAPLARHKVAVKKSSEIFSLIERYCPRIIAKIPGLAEAGYIKNRECWGRPSHIYI